MFEFSFWYRLEWALNNATGCYFTKDILNYRQEYAAYRPGYIAATKLSNHDEDRAASKLGKSTAKEKLAAAVLLTTPGSPYIYYGEELGLYGTKDKGDEYVRGPMLWGDSYTTHYTDKIDATVSTNIPDVTKQTADHQSVLNTYLIFTALRNTYPALAQGTMTRHALFNESGEGEKKYKSIAAWYMTKDSEKLLVIHNFGNSEIEIPLTDRTEKAIAVSGNVQEKEDHGNFYLKLDGYASVVYLLKTNIRKHMKEIYHNLKNYMLTALLVLSSSACGSHGNEQSGTDNSDTPAPSKTSFTQGADISWVSEMEKKVEVLQS